MRALDGLGNFFNGVTRRVTKVTASAVSQNYRLVSGVLTCQQI